MTDIPRLIKQIQSHYPQELPVVEHKTEIIAAIQQHPVVIIAGDTGSGKTTQLPKLCLEAGQGKKGRIGCTQPRRIAAISVAERVGSELQQPNLVGYKVRFQDHTNPETLIKFMTDGMLLAETSQDKLLRQYDTLIIDEAHERSLNIDFLIGYLKNLLPRRPDLKIIISSATIDTDNFSRHFDQAPVIKVAGRSYPITTQYQSDEESEEEGDDRYLEQAVQAAKNFYDQGGGDILVFMPTERDIRLCVDELRKQTNNQPLVLPLFGRLQAGDQRAIFRPANQTKIIVATNVAETSITVPGIHFVVDTGLARLSRYNIRSGTTSLRVQRISQAACDQRAGRCGRTGPGHCIRLYSEADYLGRSCFTQPEIQRANLAEVILRMIEIKLGDPRQFPFLDPPAGRAISDGFRTLRELGGLDAEDQLTSRGRLMARLPLEPRLSRMIIAGAELGALREVKIIGAALAIMDPRVRPADKEAKADEAHRQFKDPKSDFLSYLNIWNAYHEFTGQTRSRSRLRKFCKTHFLSSQRMLEWLDIHQQINTLLKRESNFQESQNPASAEAIHQALTSGFLRNIGQKIGKNQYRISGGREVMIFPGSNLFNKSPQWITAASFIETSRLFARSVGAIEPEWLEPLGGELCKRNWSDPHWEKKSGQVMALEKVTLFGLLIVPGRRVNYGRINEKTRLEARTLFIQHALLAGELNGQYPFLVHNQQLLNQLREVEERVRHRGIVVDDQVLFDFYDQRLPASVYDRFTLNRYLRRKKESVLLKMSRELLILENPDDDAAYRFPPHLTTLRAELPLSYRFEPGHEEDGISVNIPLQLAYQIDPALFEWLVPGLLREKIIQLLKALPKRLRRHLVPIPESTDRIIDQLNLYQGSLYPALEREISKQFQVNIQSIDWQSDQLAPHLQMRFCLHDTQGKQISQGRCLNQLLQGQQAKQPTNAAKQVAIPKNLPQKTGITDWDFADIEDKFPLTDAKGQLLGIYFPALFPNPTARSLTLRYLGDENKALAQNRIGLRFLYMLHFGTENKNITKACKATLLSHLKQWNLVGIPTAQAATREALIGFLLDDLFQLHESCLPTEAQYHGKIATLKQQGLMRLTQQRLAILQRTLTCFQETKQAISDWSTRLQKRRGNPGHRLSEYKKHLTHLLPADFLQTHQYQQLAHTERYLKALAQRVTRAEFDPAKDEAKAKRIASAAERLEKQSALPPLSPSCQQKLAEYQQMVEEFRVSVFAPELGTAMTVSEKRLTQKWQEVGSHCRLQTVPQAKQK